MNDSRIDVDGRDTSCLPNFLVVGAAKSGTTSLYRYLSEHPDIFMPEIKEPQFFVGQRVAGRIPSCVLDFDRYRALFGGTGGYTARGEASVFYLYFYEEAIGNIVKYLGPDVRIVIVLRNPVDRALSAYQHMVRHTSEEPLSFPDALAAEESRLKEDTVDPLMYYRDMGCYYRMVRAYMDCFEQTRVVIYDEFAEHPDRTMADLYRFLGVNTGHVVDTGTRHNPGGWVWSHPLVRAAIIREGPLNRLRARIKERFPSSYGTVRRHFRRLFSRQVTLDARTRAALIEYYREDVSRLSQLLGRDLSFWLCPPWQDGDA